MSVYEKQAPFQPWDDRSLASTLPDDEIARRVGAFAWIERRLAESLRGASAKVPAAIGEDLARQAGQHEWHAQVWEEHLRGSKGTARPKGLEHLDDLFSKVDAINDPTTVLALLARVVLPRVIAAYHFHRAALGTDLDADGTRWLGIVLDDEHDGRQTIELYLQSLLGSGADADAAARSKATADLESLLVRAGGLVGPGTLGGEPS